LTGIVRTFTSKNLRGKWSLESLRQAVAAFESGGHLRTVAKEFNVPRNTLRRHVIKHSSGQEVVKQIGKRNVLTASQENDLVQVVLSLESRLFGLSVRDLRRLIFQYCERNKITHPFNKDTEMAGEDWVTQFLKRHSNLSVRKPEGMSIGRAIGFNKEKTKRFYDLLKSVLFNGETLVIPDCNIVNVDETGLTICQRPQKVVAEKGKRCVSTLTSAEKGKTVTVICCVSAIGTFIPPMIIFPRVRMKRELIDKAPNGTIGVAAKSGWVNEQKFLEWFDHFTNNVMPKSRDRPVVLIMDGHSSHTKNLMLIEKAIAHNVILLALPSHCTHRMQPLDVSVFKSLKTYYNQGVQCWFRRHPGRPVTEYQLAELFAEACVKSATVGNAISGFRSTGIVPFNSEIFSDVDFAAAAITEQDVVLEQEADHQSVSPTFITIPVDGSDDIKQLLLEVIAIPEEQFNAIPENNCDYQPLVESSLAVGAGSISSNSDNQPIITVPVGQTYDCIWETSSETINIPVDNSNDCESLTSAITPVQWTTICWQLLLVQFVATLITSRQRRQLSLLQVFQ